MGKGTIRDGRRVYLLLHWLLRYPEVAVQQQESFISRGVSKLPQAAANHVPSWFSRSYPFLQADLSIFHTPPHLPTLASGIWSPLQGETQADPALLFRQSDSSASQNAGLLVFSQGQHKNLEGEGCSPDVRDPRWYQVAFWVMLPPAGVSFKA